MFYDYFRKEERFIDETCKNTGDCLDEPRIPLRGIVEHVKHVAEAPTIR